MDPEKTFILVDTSYWIFYRYYAIIQWWNHAKQDNPLGANPYENEEFLEKFVKTFTESIIKIKKILFKKQTTKQTTKQSKKPKVECTIIAARDCHRKDIWRNSVYSDYKETRDKDDSFMGGPFFNHAYQEDHKLIYSAGVNHVLQFPTFEADDIIALTKNFIRNKYPKAKIFIIANDHDYLQLLDDDTEIVNFQNKFLKESKNVFTEPQKNLFYKIVLGDKSDNIKPIFKKCGPKTCEKYYENEELFLQALKKEEAQEKYELNKKLVSFLEIPQELITNFIKENSEILNKL